MATREQILNILAAASGPLSRAELGEKVGESYRRFQTQLNRWVKAEYLQDVGDHHYILTDVGRERAMGVSLGTGFEEPDDLPGDVSLGEDEGDEETPQAVTATGETVPRRPPTQATVGSTEFQQFIRLGRNIGVVPMQLIDVTANHIWNGGNYADLNWVGKALQQMGIQRDLANRWLHAWGSHLKQPMPLDLPQEFYSIEGKTPDERSEGEKKQGVGKREYMLDEDNNLIFMGRGLGTLDYQDALDLAKIRGLKRKDGAVSGSTSSTPGSVAEEMTKMLQLFKEFIGAPTDGKTYVVRPGEEGYQVEEAVPGKPILVPAAAQANPAKSFYTNSEGVTQELQPGQPLVIIKEAPRQSSPTQQYLIDQRTGEMKEVTPGQPIIIKSEAPPAQATPIQMTDRNGNPIILDINTFIRLEEHKDKQKRDDESHQVKMEIGRGFKDILKHAENAFSNMGED